MMKQFNQLIQNLFDHSKTIPVSKIPFDNEVRRLCEQNMCGQYGKNWTCPPAIDTIEKLQSRMSIFNHFLVFYKIYPLEDSFDWEGMMISVKDFQSRTFKLKKKIQHTDPELNFFILGAGSCQLCDTCTYPQQKPCKNPEDALFSIESFGIDAMKIMKDNGLQYNNGPNTVTYIGGLFYPGA
jgi:predicted metal-binding protein